ncbi:MAG TPA: glycosyltransferase, partial [Candidatus Methylomirabilis sp.]|nr:glycosyltransferase [Candidatus Methylomirabilis sp.]
RGAAAPRVVVSLRDVLVSKKNQPWYEATVLAVALQWIDRILVHGSPEVIPLTRTFRLANRLLSKVLYTGYLASPPASPTEAILPAEVVISGGGGRVAGNLFRTALEARPLCSAAAARPWRILTGPYLPEQLWTELQRQTADLGSVAGRPAVVLERFRDDFSGLLRGAALSISQAGYNTVLDIISTGVRAVVVPYEGSGDEQPLRARILAERGFFTVVPERELSAARLAAAMQATLAASPSPAPARLNLDGAEQSAKILAGLVDEVLAARQAATGMKRRGDRPYGRRR